MRHSLGSVGSGAMLGIAFALAVSVACGAALGLGALAMPAHAQRGGAQASQDWSVPREPLQIGPPVRSNIEPVMPAAPRIEPRRPEEAQPMTAPPATSVAPALPGDGRSAAVERELQKLARTAYAGGAYGATAASAQAAWLLGLIHLHGAGVRVDTALAEQWFSRAARQGREPWAFAGLAWCALESCAGPPDPAGAERAIARLRASHPARADYLAWLLALRKHPMQPALPGTPAPFQASPQGGSPATDAALLERAAAAGDIHASIELGLDAVAQQQTERAAQFFRRAASRSPAARANLRELDQRAGATSTGAAPVTGAADATAALAQARKYHRGDGVPANFAEAIRFYRLADQRGSPEARRMLALIFSRPGPDSGLNVQWMQQLARADTASDTPSLGLAAGGPTWEREPTPLFDLLPAFWQRQVVRAGR